MRKPDNSNEVSQYTYRRWTITIRASYGGTYAYVISDGHCTSAGAGYPTASQAQTAAEKYIEDGGCL